MSDFDFISDPALRSNIDQANELILELVILTDSKEYQNRRSLISSLRKTIIVQTATIIEALLLWKLRDMFKSGEVELDDEWDYKDPHKIYKLPDTDEEIVWCRRKIVKKQLDRLDFLHITRLCEKHQILQQSSLINDVNSVRVMRNKLHIGGLTEVEKHYQPKDLEFCFSVLKRVKELILSSKSPKKSLH